MSKVYLLITGLLVVVSGCTRQVMDKNMIFEAIELGDTVRIQQYLDSGADINVRKDCDIDPSIELKAATPLALAIITGNIEIIELLLANGADVNAKMEGDITPLIISIFQENKRIVELLLANGADVNTKMDGDITPLNSTPLHSAYAVGNKEIIGLLIASGADVNAKMEGGLIPSQVDMSTLKDINICDINTSIDKAIKLLEKAEKALKKHN